MALIDLKIHSNELMLESNVTIVYPDPLLSKNDFNVLFLLHGYTGASTDWLRYTDIEKLAYEYNIMVVMPSINNSFYTNMEYGLNYFNYYTIELPNRISELFKVKLTKDNTYIAGLSMGGYGALKAALTNVDNYKAVAAFSGVLDIKKYIGDLEYKLFKGIFGDLETFNKNRKTHDLFELTKNLENKDLKIYIACGSEDFLIEHNRDFVKHLVDSKIKHVYDETPGDHTWDFWNKEIKKALKYFFEE